MAQCKACKKKGLFLSLNKHNLCSECEQTVGTRINEISVEVIRQHKAIENSKNLGSKLQNTKDFLENLELLDKYESQGIKTTTPSANELISIYENSGIELLNDEFVDIAQIEVSGQDSYNRKMKLFRELENQFNYYKSNFIADDELLESKELLDMQIECTISLFYGNLIDNSKNLEKNKDYINARNKLEKAFEILVKEKEVFGDGEDLRTELNDWIKNLDSKIQTPPN